MVSESSQTLCLFQRVYCIEFHLSSNTGFIKIEFQFQGGLMHTNLMLDVAPVE